MGSTPSSNKSATSNQGEMSQDLAMSMIQAQSEMSNPPAREFIRFSELPYEIRQIIWNMALTAPQIHILAVNNCTHSQINITMQACTEARAEGLRLKLPYYILRKRPPPTPEQEFLSQKHYINWEVDTFWCLHKTSYAIELWTSLYCNCCILDRGSLVGYPKLLLRFCDNFTLRRGDVAISIGQWADIQPSKDSRLTCNLGTALELWYHGNVRHVYIVVNAEETPGLRVEFIEPTMPPGKRKFGKNTPQSSWKLMAEEKVQMMEAYKAKLGEWRKTNESQSTYPSCSL